MNGKGSLFYSVVTGLVFALILAGIVFAGSIRQANRDGSTGVGVGVVK